MARVPPAAAKGRAKPHKPHRPRSLAAASPPRPDPRSYFRSGDGARSDVKLKTREAAFRQGDPADAVFYVNSGRIQLMALSDQGKEGVIALFSAGDFFGEGCLTAQPLRMASAIATMPSSVARIERMR